MTTITITIQIDDGRVQQHTAPAETEHTPGQETEPLTLHALPGELPTDMINRYEREGRLSAADAERSRSTWNTCRTDPEPEMVPVKEPVEVAA